MAHKAASSSPRPLAPSAPAPPPLVVAPPSPTGSASASGLLALAPTSSSSILIYLAALVSAGILIRTLHPRFRYRLANSSNKTAKRRDTVIKKIIAQQEATPTDRAVKPSPSGPSAVRSRSGTLTAGRERSLSSACVATTSAAITSGLSKITTVATGAIASTSRAKLDSPIAIGTPAAKLGSAGPQRDGKGAPTSNGSGSEDAFSTGVGRLLSVEQGGKKGKGKKGKGVASSSSHTSSLAATPSASPARRPSTRSSSVEPESVPTFEVSTQTAFDPPRIERTTTTGSTPTPTALHPQFDVPLPESDSDSHPPPSTPPKPPPIAAIDATVQTSPRLAARPPIPPPSLPRPFDLHASFQSTPPVRPTSQPPTSYPVPSPPPSPSPSRRLSALPPTTSPRISNRPTPSPTDLLSSSTTNSPSPSPASSRSRKQARKASAAAASGVGAQQTIVVGMPRPPRSRDTTDELEMDGGETGESPKLLRVDTSSSRLSQSSDKSSVGLHSAEKGKGKEKEQGVDSRAINGTAMGSGKGRYGIPAPIPIPPAPPAPTRTSSDQRRLSTSTTGTGSGASAGSSSTSPYLSHQILMTMTPPDAGRRASVTSAKGSSTKNEEAYWRGDEGAREKWEPGMMGLAIELNEEERRSREDGSVDGRRAGSAGNGTARSWSSTGGSSSPNIQSLSDGYFPPGAHTAMTSPDSSPHPPSRQLLPLSSTSNQRPWSPQLMAQQYTMIPYPVSSKGDPSTPQQPAPLPHTHSSGGGQNSHPRPSSRQTSLSVPPNTAQQQQAAHLQQQQAYAFYAHAQAQYQHVIVLQLQAQQHHQRQVAQQQHQQQQQQQQQRQRHDSEHSTHSNGPKPPPTPNGLVYPISGTHIAPPPTPQSLAQAQAQAQGWSTLPGSPAFPPPSGSNGQYGIGSSVSPTSATFPSSASSSSYSHIHQLPQVQQANSNAYYLGSPTATYLNNYSMSPQMPQLGQRQPSSSKRGSGGGRNQGGGGDGEKLKSPRPGADRQRSASAAAITTMSSSSLGSGSNGPPPSDMAGWKSKARVAEMDADRSAKELEIARWRLAVLEEEQRTIELENQEALRALATRAMRAEARIKLLEEARAHDSSSASGSGSPATRPSSIAGSSEMPAEMLPPPISFDENDSSARDSPPGVKVHPLAWLDLDTVSFNVRPPSNVRPAFNSTPSGRRKGGRTSNEFKNSRRNNTRRRSSNGGNGSFGTPTAPPLEDAEEEEVLILLDSPLRRKSIPQNPVSRRSSFLGDDFSFDQSHETSSNLDEDEMSNLDFDEAESRSARGEPTGTSEYIGFLPTFLKPGNSSRPPSVAGSASPHLGPLSVLEDQDGEEAAAGEEEEEGSEMIDAVECGGDSDAGLQIRVNGFSPTIDPDVSLPSFTLDTATPDLSEEERSNILPTLHRPPSPAPSPPPMSVASSDYSSATLSVNGSEERTPRVAPPPSPPVGGGEEEQERPSVAAVLENGAEEAAEELAPEKTKDVEKDTC